MLSEDFTLAGARRAAARGQLEAWVHEYLLGPGRNRPFSEGLKLRPRRWRDPELLPLRMLQRTCGPEHDMPFQVSLESFQQRVRSIVSTFRELELCPPLIAQDQAGQLMVNDGNHRLAAFEMLGLSHCWVIVWHSDDEHEKRRNLMRE